LKASSYSLLEVPAVTNTTSLAKNETLFSGLGRMIGAEFLKLRKRTLTKVLVFILAGIIALVNLLLLAISKVNLPTTGSGQVSVISTSCWVYLLAFPSRCL
jgi:hypothetical protein